MGSPHTYNNQRRTTVSKLSNVVVITILAGYSVAVTGQLIRTRNLATADQVTAVHTDLNDYAQQLMAAAEPEPLPYVDPKEAYPITYEWYEVLDAIRRVETGAEPNKGIGALGDPRRDKNGNIVRDADGNVLEWCAIGPFQIWGVYYQDATEHTYPNIDTSNISYDDCATSMWASETIVLAYMYRHARPEFQRLEAGTATIEDVEKIARIHNGGPTGHTKSATLGYWAKVRESL